MKNLTEVSQTIVREVILLPPNAGGDNPLAKGLKRSPAEGAISLHQGED